ncbi:MAG TPA: hypothetical protein VK095_11815 [Beutenbergiaceae bacterium]|nr:hypothetical protein [Beutenbergiaceae bacterium]
MSNPYASPDPARRPDPERRPDPDREPSGQAGVKTEHEADGDRRADANGTKRPERPRPTPEQMAPISKAVLRFGLLMLGAVLTAQLDLPWQLISPLLTVAAIVVGVRTLVSVIRQRLGVTIVVLLSGGLALSGMLLLTSLGSLVMWEAQMDRQQCMRTALTVSAEDQCEAAYQEALTERFGDVTPGD